MNKPHQELSKYQSINIEHLNRGSYFQALLMEAIYNDLLDQKQAEKIKMDLLYLLKKQTDKYTSGDSSSVRVEIAEQITQSIYYCIGAYLKTVPEIDDQITILKQEEIEHLFHEGIKVTRSYLDNSKKLLKTIKSNHLVVNNQAYLDTISSGISPFFLEYDLRYAANEIPGSIDYPLSVDSFDLLGIEYIYEYLLHLSMENDFCSNYTDSDIEILLKGYSKDYTELLVNIYELVLTNAVGCSILGIEGLDINESNRELLQQKLEGHSVEELVNIFENEFQNICSKFNITDKQEIEYLKLIIKPISSRIKRSIELGKLETIFITQKEKSEEEFLYYEDGLQMEDDELRYLIEEMKECRYLSDKIEIIQQNIRSLSDLVEVLEECFYGDEINNVFELLGDNELSELSRLITEEQESHMYTIRHWHVAVKNYIELKARCITTNVEK